MNTLLSHTKRVEFIKTVAATGTPERLTSGAISAITRLGANNRFVEATVSPNPHCMIPGSEIVITGATEPEFNGTFTILKRSATDKVIFEAPGVSASVTGTPIYYANVWFRHAILLGLKAYRTTNLGIVYVGGSSVDGEQPYGTLPYDPGIAGETYLPASNAGAAYENLADYYVDVLNNADGLLVRYL